MARLRPRLPLLLLPPPLLLLMLLLSPALARRRESCVLTASGAACSPASAVRAAVRAPASPCARADAECWCIKALEYTNAVRAKHGVRGMLSPGPVKQLDNALWYARELDRRTVLRHQVLRDVTKEVRCERWIGGENIAYNYEDGDIARACVRQWENSKLHFQNLVRDWFEEVVIGVHVAHDGRVYCVQTFSLIYDIGTFGDLNDARCTPVRDDRLGTGAEGGDDAPTPVGTAPPPTTTTRATTTRATTTRATTTRATTTGATTTRATTSPPQTRRRPSDDSNKRRGMTADGELRPMSKRRGYHACRCLEVGSRCWAGMRRRTGGRCTPFKAAAEQGQACKRKCCQYCEHYPAQSACRSRNVRAACGGA